MRKLLKKICKHCKQMFLTFDSARIYCDIKCKELEEEPHAELPPDPDEIRFCKFCGRRFTTSNLRQKYCSTKCAYKIATEQKRRWHIKHRKTSKDNGNGD